MRVCVVLGEEEERDGGMGLRWIGSDWIGCE